MVLLIYVKTADYQVLICNDVLNHVVLLYFQL